VDKTRFIELLENEANSYLFFTRPRKFGKSLFFSMLSHYYDINGADKFNTLFGDMYIGKNPTSKHSSYVVLNLDFSGLNTNSEEDFKISFTGKIRQAVLTCLENHKDCIPDVAEYLQECKGEISLTDKLNIVFRAAKSIGCKVFVIIDEYDHFANDLIAMGNRLGKDFYKTMVSANGLVCDFYERIKASTKSIPSRTFITGISPVMLDDLTSGYNISTNLTLNYRYNEMTRRRQI
jgi:hypothetical protein